MQLTRRTLLKLGSFALARAFLPPLPKMDFYTDGDDAIATPTLRRPVINFARGLAYGAGAAIRSEPNLKAPQVGKLKRDNVLPIYAEFETESGSAHNKLWYEVEGGYLYSALAHPVRWQLNAPVTNVGEEGFWAEVTVPFVDSRAAPSLKAPKTRYRYYGGTVYKVIKAVKAVDKSDSRGIASPAAKSPTPSSKPSLTPSAAATPTTSSASTPAVLSGPTDWWYQIEDEIFPGKYFVPASHLRPVSPKEFTPLSPNVDPIEKKITVNLKEQQLYAYEKDEEVFTCRTATGTYFNGQDFTTTLGRWNVFRKTPSQHMYGGAVGDAESFDLPGIPWVSYFTTTGIAIHGTYWHNDYGVPRSHGCVNVSGENAKWVWRWSMPPNDYKERYSLIPPKERKDPSRGTSVLVE